MRKQNALLAATILIAWGATAFGEDAATKPAAAKPPFTISKETTGITSPLRPDGSVDYVAALNEKYGKGVSRENNGFVVWLQVVPRGEIPEKSRGRMLELLGITEEYARGGNFMAYSTFLKEVEGFDEKKVQALGEARERALAGLWKEQDFPELAAWLKHEAKNLDLAEVAAGRERWFSPYVGDSVAESVLPTLGVMREVTNGLCARALLRADAGDMVGFETDVTGAQRLARAACGGPSLVECLSGMAMEGRACVAIGAAAGSGKWGNENVMWRFRPLFLTFESMYVIERWTQLDFVQKIAMGKDVGPGKEEVMKQFAGLDREAVDWDLVLQSVEGELNLQTGGMGPSIASLRKDEDYLEARIEKLKVAARGQTLEKGKDEEREAYSRRVADRFTAMLMPSMRKAEELRLRTEMVQKMTEVVMATAAYHVKKGKWPEKLEGYVVGGIEGIPRDIYSKDGKERVRYLVTERGVRVYSVGPNGVDDGGVKDAGAKKDDIVVGVLEK